MIRVPILGAIFLLSGLLAAVFGAGTYYGASYALVNTKTDWCYIWAHEKRWELSQAKYLQALEWCDDWKAGRIKTNAKGSLCEGKNFLQAQIAPLPEISTGGVE